MIGKSERFFGWRVVAAVFVLAMFGWGLGFYGLPVYLHAVRESRGWPLAMVSAAVTVHLLFGALTVANLPGLYRRWGVAAVTKAGVLALAAGVLGWAAAREPWHLIAAALVSGAGWATMGAAAVNAIVAPWFFRNRPAALAAAYNGSSIGGLIFSPLWVAAIGWLGFEWAALSIGLVTVATIWLLASVYYAKTPEQLALAPDGATPPPATAPRRPLAPPLPPRGNLWTDARFVTLTAGMALGLFAQIGLLAHLFSLLVPALGEQIAGFATGGATIAAIAGRTWAGRLIPGATDSRLLACASYGVQILGSLALLLAGGDTIALLLLGVLLFGAGIGNATSLPPTIAHIEFAKEEAARAVPLIIAVAQASYAFAPAAFGLIRDAGPSFGATAEGAAPCVFLAAALLQATAISVFLIGRPHAAGRPVIIAGE